MSGKLRLIIALAIIVTGIVIVVGRHIILKGYEEDDFFSAPGKQIRIIQPSNQ